MSDLSNFYLVNFYYDAQRQGYDTTLWKTLSGTPAVAGNNLRFSNASAINYGDIIYCDLVLRLNIPTAPTAGDSRKFGFYQPNLGAYIYFYINGTAFTASCADGSGSTTDTAITWVAGWEGASTDYRIKWDAFGAVFYVNNQRVATLVGNSTGFPKKPLSFYLLNGTASNMDMISLNATAIHSYI